ncbi:hypothetical protein [Streptomyces cellostaticus]|uniref:hypothetical protein n=1 Tax=Streptomyces cellostaticus TaxID=67285 RepID=UPI0020273EB0|nr:hypothetical protein [Streptomyces cellostaticus]
MAELERAGLAFCGAPDGIGLYGMPAGDWYAAGVRIAGRTCVEAALNGPSRRVAETVRRSLAPVTTLDRIGVVDLFAGSGNLMLHVRDVLGTSCVGMDADPVVFELTRGNFGVLDLPASMRLGSWASYFLDPLPDVDATLFVLAPPWGPAFSFDRGLDLRRTNPPVGELVEHITRSDRSGRRFAVIQLPVHEPVVAASVRELTKRYRQLDRAVGCLVLDLT